MKTLLLAILLISATIANAQLQCHASVYPPQSCIPRLFTFTDSSTGGASYYEWDFSNGTSAQKNPTSYYTTPGVYTVKHKVYDQYGDSSVCYVTVTVNITDAAHLSRTGTDTICGGDSVVFTAMPDTFYHYYFYIGASLVFDTTANQWQTNGFYNENLISVYGKKNGCLSAYPSNVDTMHLSPTPLPTLNITPSDTNGVYIANYTISQSQPPYNYLWNFGDGDTSTEAYPIHSYTAAGQYNVCLTVTSTSGCSNTDCDSTFYVFKKEGGLMSKLIVQDGSVITGITNTDGNVAISVYPNPSINGEWQLTLSDQLIGSKLEMFDVEGRVLFNSIVQNTHTSIKAPLAAGVYLLRISNALQSRTVRLVSGE